jgi:hypothetical protein
MTDGMWLDLQIQPRDFDRQEAKQAIEMFLRQLFPAEFARASDNGLDATCRYAHNDATQPGSETP